MRSHRYPVYTRNRGCNKCGHGKWFVKYVKRTLFRPEHMRRRCDLCGYIQREAPVDAA